jgi:hypothetical protein
MDVELAALRASARRRLGLVDRRGYALDMKDARENEPAEAGADDRDWLHRAAAMVRDHGLNQKYRPMIAGKLNLCYIFLMERIDFSSSCTAEP